MKTQYKVHPLGFLKRKYFIVQLANEIDLFYPKLTYS